MLARLFVHLPFHLTVPEGEKFTVYEYEDSGYKVRFFPPERSELAPAIDGPEQLKIDGVSAFQADLLRIDFSKESFERGIRSPCDPPYDVINRAVNSFLLRIRHVTRAPQVRQVDFPSGTWHLQYLNDDETEPEKDEKFVRVRRALQFEISWIALNKEVWGDIHNLPPDYEPPAWDSLLLDANAELSRIGPSIVLAWTALEVFISQMLDQLATVKNMPMELWTWINQRDDRRQEPTVEEQFDALLKCLTDHSLKEEQKLWESFKNLRTARNSFVHEGVAKVGGLPINTEMTRKLIASASMIIQKVREWLPQDLHWPEFRHEVKVEITRQLK
ncbi:MAG: hypothetical protein RX316_06445 [bacterium]|nr:hypothetical protein [bacterium]